MIRKLDQPPKDFADLPLVLSISQVVQVLNLGRDTTYGLVRSGHIRSVRVGRQYWVPKTAVAEYLSYRTVYDCFKRLMVKIGAPATRFDELWHTYAVMAIQSGDDIKTVQENLGHATAAFTLDVYGHVTAQMKQASADRMEEFIQSVSA